MLLLTIDFVLSSIASGIIGNTSHLSGVEIINQVKKNIKNRIKLGEPPINHDIQRAVRQAYLQATLVVCEHSIKKIEKDLSFLGRIRGFAQEDQNYLKSLRKLLLEEIQSIPNENYIPRNDLIDKEVEILLQPKGDLAYRKIEILKTDLKSKLLKELNNWKLTPSFFKECVLYGWTDEKDESIKYDWFDLMCAFFAHLLKTSHDRLQRIFTDTVLSQLPVAIEELVEKWENWGGAITTKIDLLHYELNSLKETNRSNFNIVETKLDDIIPYLTGLNAKLEGLETSQIRFGQNNIGLLCCQLTAASKDYYSKLIGPNGRFHHLIISDTIIPNLKSDFIETDVIINEQQQVPLKKSIEQCWEKECKHSIIVGEGGMGKTVSLIKLWEKHLFQNEQDKPIILFLALNEYNNASHEYLENFIIKSIGKNYLNKEHLSKDEENFLWTLIRTPKRVGNRFNPSVILLLDGFNEITKNNLTPLLIELNELKSSDGIQLVITSRYDMRPHFNWNDFNRLELIELEDHQIDTYLNCFSVEMPRAGMLKLVRNPMMLTVYAATSEIVDKYTLLDFKKPVHSTGELLWNFLEGQMVKLMEPLVDYSKFVYYKFILKHLLPYIGYEMEKSGAYYLSTKELKKLINECFILYNNDQFFDTFEEYGKYSAKFQFGDPERQIREERFYDIEQILCKEVFMLVKESNSYRFLHQHFRDFFAALFVLNEIQICLEVQEIPKILAGRLLPPNIRRFVGEIEGEHYNKPCLTEHGWSIDHYASTKLKGILDLCKNSFDYIYAHTVLNVIEIFKEVRGELTGLDLSNLDLSLVDINGVRCYRKFDDYVIHTNFDGALITEMSIFPKGHAESVSSAIISPCGTKLLTCSGDFTIKEWSYQTFNEIKTYIGHLDWVNSAIYSPDNSKILSSSEDHSVKEWCTKTGEILLDLKGHTEIVRKAVYSSDGKKILTASDDGSIKEWDVHTGGCIRTYYGHSGKVSCAVYSDDSKKILSSSYDKTIKEWDTASGDCLFTYNGHEGWVTYVCYSKDFRRILSCSDDKTIKEWEVGHETFIKSLEGHSGGINTVTYSEDSKKILSSSNDKTIREWDLDTENCIKIFEGHSAWVNSAVYIDKGERILSSAWDGSVKIWHSKTLECIQTIKGHSNQITSAIYNEGETKVIYACGDKTVKEWDLQENCCDNIYSDDLDWVSSAIYSKDGLRILAATGFKTITEWDVKTGECIRTFRGHSGWVRSAVYSNNGMKILSAAGEGDKTVREWDSLSGECLAVYPHTDWVRTAVYSNDDKKILSASYDNTIKEWDINTRQCIQEYIGHTEWVRHAIYNDDNSKILSSSGDKTIKQWDTTTGLSDREFKGHTASVNSALYNSTGEKILSASTDKTIREWDVKTGVCIKTFFGHKGRVISAVYNYNGKKILSSSWDGTIKEWDVTNTKCIREIKNISGLIIKGCLFTNLHANSNISDANRINMKMYGAQVD